MNCGGLPSLESTLWAPSGDRTASNWSRTSFFEVRIALWRAMAAVSSDFGGDFRPAGGLVLLQESLLGFHSRFQLFSVARRFQLRLLGVRLGPSAAFPSRVFSAASARSRSALMADFAPGRPRPGRTCRRPFVERPQALIQRPSRESSLR